MVQNTIQRRLKRAFVPIFVVEKHAEMDGRLTVKFKFSAEIGQLGAQNLLKHPHDQALRLRILRLAGKSYAQHTKTALDKMVVVIPIDRHHILLPADSTDHFQQLLAA